MADFSQKDVLKYADYIPTISSGEFSDSHSDLYETIRWHQNEFAKGITETLPDLVSIIEKPKQWLTEEVDFWAELASNFKKPDFRKQLAESVIDSTLSINANNAAHATGLLIGAIASPGGKKSIFSHLVPNSYGMKYVEDMLIKARSLPKDRFDPKQWSDLEKSLSTIRPIDTGNPIKNFILDHVPVSLGSPSTFIRRAYIEHELGLIAGEELASRTLATNTMKLGIATIGSLGYLYRDEVFSNDNPRQAKVAASNSANQDNAPKPPVTTPQVDNKNLIEAECADLLDKVKIHAAIREYLQQGEKHLSEQSAKTMECLGLALIDQYISQSQNRNIQNTPVPERPHEEISL